MMTAVFNKDACMILTVFSLSPGSRLSRNEIKRKTKLNNVNLDTSLNILMSAGLLAKDKRFLRLDTEKYGQIKAIADDYKHLNKIPLDAYFSALNIIHFLSRLRGIDAYLFGSYSKLIYNEKSDLDIAVISDKINNHEKKEISKLIRKTEARYGRSIEAHYFGRNFYKNKKDPLVKEILRNGIKII